MKYTTSATQFIWSINVIMKTDTLPNNYESYTDLIKLISFLESVK
jgi:hypothetical protein